MGEPYAPRGLVADDRELGLTTSRVDTELGSVAVRHSPHRTSSIATLLLHGAAGSWTTWTPMLATAVAEGHPLGDIVAIDLPGWGDSPGPDIRSRLTLDALADTVWQVVRGALGYERVDVVGHSLGGFIALHLAATRPDCVTAVRLVSSTSFAILESIEHPLRRFGEVPAFTMLLGVFRVLRTFGDRASGPVLLARRLGLLRVLMSPLFRHPARMPQSVIDALADEVRPDTFVRAAEETRGYATSRLWPTVRCPVWAVRGADDVFVPASDLADLIVVIPGIVLTEVPDCGHFAHIERPVGTLAALGLLGESRP
ncbi:alpha/beta fold hydrolase [Agreia sp. COWG]|uniref:alpha/beta fold hydrolase n=1 Tax=Agreia sp. COWG TaxID=2773266 RepID=UPI0019258DDD|nr:alpha/beta hydrolase [Agreia sp. COWG]CAD5996454.1 Pimeloyl-ACP methyl ester carboxylesterase [Agreia sp. COWG]